MTPADRVCWVELRRALLIALRAIETRLEASDKETPREPVLTRR